MQHVNDQRFFRSNNRILGGVCAGLADGFHVDPLWVRLIFLLLVFVQGLGLFLYIVLWLVMPEKVEGGGQRSGFDPVMEDVRRIGAEFQHQLGGSPRPAPPTPAASSATPTAATPDPSTPTPHPQAGWQSPTVLAGVILVVIGLALLANNAGIINWSVVWPAALITFGIVILVRTFDRRL